MTYDDEGCGGDPIKMCVWTKTFRSERYYLFVPKWCCGQLKLPQMATWPVYIHGRGIILTTSRTYHLVHKSADPVCICAGYFGNPWPMMSDHSLRQFAFTTKFQTKLVITEAPIWQRKSHVHLYLSFQTSWYYFPTLLLAWNAPDYFLMSLFLALQCCLGTLL